MISMVLPREEEQTYIENLSYYRHDPVLMLLVLFNYNKL